MTPSAQVRPIAPKVEPRLKRFAIPVLIFVVITVIYSITAWNRVLKPSPHFHFVDLAHSFMEGRLDTDTPRRRRNQTPSPEDPKGLQEAVNRALTDENGNGQGWNDWASFRELTLTGGETVRGVWPWKDDSGSKRKHEFVTLAGDTMVIDPETDIAKGCGDKAWRKCDEIRYYISFPPFPAVVMVPFVAIWGYFTNDVLITILIAGINAVLIFLMLQQLVRRGYAARTTREQLWFVALFAFGTVTYFSSIRGEVWFTALVIGLSLNIAYLMAALDARHPVLAGVFLALGFATRTPILFAGMFFATQLFIPASGDHYSWGTRLKKVVLFALPCLVVGVGLMIYNEARFERFGEFGHSYLAEGTRDSIRRHGLFSFWFLNRNLSAMFTNMPVFTATAPYIHITRHGLGLLATTPVFFLLFRPKPGNRRLIVALVATIVATVVPALLYQNTGWAQFGYRFSLDWTPFMIALLAIDSRPITKKYVGLILFSILVNLFGAITFGRAPGFYYD